MLKISQNLQYFHAASEIRPLKDRPNLEKDENVTLKDLSKRDSITITNAHKGVAVVIIDLNDYIREAKRQLKDSVNSVKHKSFYVSIVNMY